MSEKNSGQREGTDQNATDLAALRAEIETIRKELDALRCIDGSVHCGADCYWKSDPGKVEAVSNAEIGESLHVDQADHVDTHSLAGKTRTWLARIKQAIEEDFTDEQPVRWEQCHAIMAAIEGLSLAFRETKEALSQNNTQGHEKNRSVELCTRVCREGEATTCGFCAIWRTFR